MLDGSLMLKATEADAAPEPLFVHLVRLLLLYQPARGQGNDIPHNFQVSWPEFRTTLDIIMPQLMRSVDSPTVQRVFQVIAESDRTLVPWMEQLCAQLLKSEHGFNPNAFNNDGSTPVLAAAARGNVSLILVLHSLGADCSVQRLSDGASVLHLLVERRAYDELCELFSRGIPELDLFSVNHAGHTPLELAAIRHAQQHEPGARLKAWQVAQILSLQTEAFRNNVSPLIRRMLSAHILPDLANIALGYIDGSGRAHPSTAAASSASESKENDAE